MLLIAKMKSSNSLQNRDFYTQSMLAGGVAGRHSISHRRDIGAAHQGHSKQMAAQNNAPLPEGLNVAGYRIVRKIAAGGFSIVYLAQDDEGKPVAIKEYLPSSLALRKSGELAPLVAPENLPVFRIGLKCFFEEGRALARINHPNVVSVQNFFRAHDTVYMVMAYEHGRSLQDHILRRRERGEKPLVSERFIRKMFSQVMQGLREVHANKLLHLDLKPANIYLRQDGTPILLDFGAARQTLRADLPKLYPMYTPGFAPPELYTRGGSLGPWSDIYSIGASMFACMVGAPPQPADQRLKNDRMEHHYDKLHGVYSPELIEVIRWCLLTDPLRRPQSVFALQKALRQELQEPAPAPDLLTRMKRQLRAMMGPKRQPDPDTIQENTR
jgi:serine/threonine protein kinase